MTTSRQDTDLQNEIENNCKITVSIEGDMQFLLDYINDNMSPEEVFSDTSLDLWATNNGYIKE